MKLAKELWGNRELILQLAKNDFRNKYITSYLGILWGFIPSIATIIIYWFIFNVGFRVLPVDNVPYLLWLMCGLIPWFFFSDGIVGGINSYIEYSYLVKKMSFKISILPLVKIIASLFVHIFFIVLNIYIFFMNGFLPDIYYLQIIYYVFALTCLILSVSFFSATLNLFFRDLGQIVLVLLQLMVWMTPIMWNISMFSSKIVKVLKLNPMFYIVQGYRETFIEKVYFWQHPIYTLYFWVLVLSIMIIGIKLFKKLKPHFADLL